MEINSKNLKKLIVLRFGSLQKCADDLMITPSTLSRNLSNPSKKFVEKLKLAGVPVDEKIGKFLISKDGFEGAIIKEPKSSALPTEL